MSVSNTFGAEQNCLSVHLPSTFYCMYIVEVEKGESCLGINPYKAVHLWNGVYLVDYHLPRHGLNIPRRLSGPATTSQLAEATVRENNHHLLVPRLLWTWPWAHYLSALCPRELGVGEQMVAIWCQKGKNLCREKNVLQILRVPV